MAIRLAGGVGKSQQARYLLQCVDVLRHLQRTRLADATASYLEICRVEAGYIISGCYCLWAVK